MPVIAYSLPAKSLRLARVPAIALILTLLLPAWGATVLTRHPVWLRAAPDAVARLMLRLPAQAPLTQLGERFGPWIRVQSAEGPTGWLLDLDVQGAQLLPAVAPLRAQSVAGPLPPAQLPPPQQPSPEQRLAQARTYAVDADTARRFAKRIGLRDVAPSSNAELAAEAAAQAALGHALAQSVLARHALSADVALQTYVNLLGRWLSLGSEQPDLRWTFAVLDDAEAQAWAAPGGYVFITQGLVQRLRTEADLAAVLAHAMVLIDEPDLWAPLLATSQVGGMTAAQALYLAPGFGAPAQYGADRSAALLLSRCGLPAHAMLDAIRQAEAAPSTPSAPVTTSTPGTNAWHLWLNRLLGRSTVPPAPTRAADASPNHSPAERMARLQAFLEQRDEADISTPGPTIEARLEQLANTVPRTAQAEL